MNTNIIIGVTSLITGFILSKPKDLIENYFKPAHIIIQKYLKPIAPLVCDRTKRIVFLSGIAYALVYVYRFPDNSPIRFGYNIYLDRNTVLTIISAYGIYINELQQLNETSNKKHSDLE